MSNPYVRSKDDLLSALAEQRKFLRASCAAYDAGELHEAKRMAATVYTLLHDGGRNSRSLMTQLDLKGKTKFLSTARSIDDRAIPKTYLATAHIGNGYDTFIPNCYSITQDTEYEYMSFSAWWIQKAMETLPKKSLILGMHWRGNPISRKNLVFNLRSQDGGAHLDPSLSDEAYVEFSVHHNTGMLVGYGDSEPEPLPNAHLATMRQIAWELEHTLKSIPGGPDPIEIEASRPAHLENEHQFQKGKEAVPRLYIGDGWKELVSLRQRSHREKR